MLSTLACMAALLPQGPGISTAAVVINEFSADDSSADTLEFVELYNRTANPVSLDGWVIQGEEGDSGGSPNLSFIFPAGTTINPRQFLVVGNSAVPNVDLVVAANFLENGPAEGITLRNPTLTVIDAVMYGFARWTAAIPPWIEGTPLQGRSLLNETVANPTSVQRRSDGYDDNNNGCDFVLMGWTPGAANGSVNTLGTAYETDCDGLVQSTLAADFATSFVPPTIVAAVAFANATGSMLSISASPQGGNIARLNDITGGGNANSLAVTVGTDFLLECYVYIAGGTPGFGPGDAECWGIGIGTTDSYAAPPDLTGTFYTLTASCNGPGNREPGATGIAWFAYNTATRTDIFLVDLNDGGPDFTVLAGPLTATSGTNDGWQRLRIRVRDTDLTANFGGTVGCDDGQRFTTTLASRCSGQPYFQYRECLAVNSLMTPLLIDELQVYGIITPSTIVAGTASPWSNGTPTIAVAGGEPVIGNLSFRIFGSGLVPNGINAVVMGLGTLDPGFPVPGTPPTVQVYINPDISTELLLSDGSGQAHLFLPIPCLNALVGLPLTSQFFTFDLALPFPLPIATSAGMLVVFGI